MRKPVFGVCNQGRLKPAHTADAQADLCLCCSHMAKTGFLMMWLILKKPMLYKNSTVSVRTVVVSKKTYP